MCIYIYMIYTRVHMYASNITGNSRRQNHISVSQSTVTRLLTSRVGAPRSPLSPTTTTTTVTTTTTTTITITTVTDGIGTPDSNPRNLLSRCL